LTDFRLDALDKARKLDELHEMISRLKNENNMLKQNCAMLEKRTRHCSRASSRQSLSTAYHDEEDHVYASPPLGDNSFSSSDTSSKRSSGGLSVRVTLSVDLSGTLEFGKSTPELTIGMFSPVPCGTTWTQLDQQLNVLMENYLRRVDPEMTLGVDCHSAIIGYQIGDHFVRNRVNETDEPQTAPADIISPSVPIRLRLKGATQNSVDALVMECLFPRTVLDQLLSLLMQSRRMVIYGATGTGKSILARHLARYLSLKMNISSENVSDIRFPDDDKEKSREVQNELETLLRSDRPSIVLIDNVQRKRISTICAAFSNVDGNDDSENDNDEKPTKYRSNGPFVICTLNRTSDVKVQEMQLRHNFRLFLLSNQMDAVRGYMGRYLRRRMTEAELNGHCACTESLQSVVEFLTQVLSIVNTFIECANAYDVTIGPRIFLQCPLSMEQSREWFIRLWNENIVPYLEKVLREGVTFIGANGTLKDPRSQICRIWPWLDGTGGETVLRSISEDVLNRQEFCKSPISAGAEFDPISALDRIAESRQMQRKMMPEVA
jgi:neuron navigator 2